jgi:hypothetical protein
MTRRTSIYGQASVKTANLATWRAQTMNCDCAGPIAARRTTPRQIGLFSVPCPPITAKVSGAIDPFLRFQHNEFQPGSNTWEAAFNTDFRDSSSGPTNTGTILLDKDQFNPSLSPSETLIKNQAKDTNAGGFNPDPFNHALMLGDLRQAIDSDGYFHFLLDINEPGNAKATLRLDELAFFVGATGDLHEFTQDKLGTSGGNLATGELAGAIARDALGTATVTDAAVWDMDFNGQTPNGAGATDSYGDPLGGMILDNVNASGPGLAGSGDYDLQLRLSAALFENYLDDDYVYLYNFMGAADEHGIDEAESGFEEWAFDTSAGGVPNTNVAEPGVLGLLGFGIAFVMSSRRRRARPLV